MDHFLRREPFIEPNLPSVSLSRSCFGTWWNVGLWSIAWALIGDDGSLPTSWILVFYPSIPSDLPLCRDLVSAHDCVKPFVPSFESSWGMINFCLLRELWSNFLRARRELWFNFLRVRRELWFNPLRIVNFRAVQDVKRELCFLQTRKGALLRLYGMLFCLCIQDLSRLGIQWETPHLSLCSDYSMVLILDKRWCTAGACTGPIAWCRCAAYATPAYMVRDLVRAFLCSFLKTISASLRKVYRALRQLFIFWPKKMTREGARYCSRCVYGSLPHLDVPHLSF